MQERVVTEKPTAKPKNGPKPAEGAHCTRDLRSALAWLKAQGDLIETDRPVDPDLEITGLQKHLDGGCPVMFHNAKGKPHHRVITNLFGDMNVINKMFGWTSDAERVKKLAAAFRGQTVRLLVTNLRSLQSRKAVLDRCMQAYREAIDTLYADPAALRTVAEWLNITEAKARQTRDEFFPKGALDPDRITGLDIIVKDAVELKYTETQLTPAQLADLIQIPPRR